jgi:hypothetical protein
MNTRMLLSLLAAGLFAFTFSGAAYATTRTPPVSHTIVPLTNPTVYDFGNLLTESGSCIIPKSFAGNPFASLEMQNLGGGVWEFLLDIHNPVHPSVPTFSNSFGSSAFIGSITFQLNPDPSHWLSLTDKLVASNGVSSVTATTGTGGSSPTFDADFGTALGGGSDKLVQNEWIEWTVSGLSGYTVTDAYVHVQGIDNGTSKYCGGSYDCSAKYTPLTPVPEPETYAMLLAGLGLVGFSARRRMNRDT